MNVDQLDGWQYPLTPKETADVFAEVRRLRGIEEAARQVLGYESLWIHEPEAMGWLYQAVGPELPALSEETQK